MSLLQKNWESALHNEEEQQLWHHSHEDLNTTDPEFQTIVPAFLSFFIIGKLSCTIFKVHRNELWVLTSYFIASSPANHQIRHNATWHPALPFSLLSSPSPWPQVAGWEQNQTHREVMWTTQNVLQEQLHFHLHSLRFTCILRNQSQARIEFALIRRQVACQVEIMVTKSLWLI